jgi:hypothetical protein
MAIQDLLKSFGQRLGSGLTQVGGYDPMQQVSPEEAAKRRLEGLSALQRGLGKSAAILSGDPRRIQLAEQEIQQAEQNKLLQQLGQDPRYAEQIKLLKAGLDPRLASPQTGSVERFTLYDKNSGKPVRTILKSEAENIDRNKFIIGPLADPFANGKDEDIETWTITDREGNRYIDLINPTEEELQSYTKKGFFLNKTPQLTTAGKAKDIGQIKGWNDEGGLQKRAISYNTLVNTGQRIINNLYENPQSVLIAGDVAQIFDQIGEELEAVSGLINQDEKINFGNLTILNTDQTIKSAISELAKETAITESQLLDFAYQIAKVRGQEGRGLSDQDFRNFRKIISAGQTAEQKAAALYNFISGVGDEVKSELDLIRELKNLELSRNPENKQANEIVTGINDLYQVGFGQINNPFAQQTPPTNISLETEALLKKYGQ